MKLALLNSVVVPRWVFGNPFAVYAANGFEPDIVNVPIDGKYKGTGGSTTLADLTNHTRSGTATYLDNNGVLQTAADGVLRSAAYRYESGVLVGPSVLTEPAATNSVVNNRSLSGWGGAATATQDAVGVDGVANKAATVSGSFASSRGKAYTIADDGNWQCASLFIKKETSVTAYPGFSFVLSGGTSVRQDVTIDPISGAVLGRTGFADGVAYIQDWGDFWRVVVAVQNNSTGNTTAQVSIFPAVASTFSDTWGTSGPQSIVVDFVQGENGAVATSPIDTSGGSTATRAADVWTIPAANMMDYQTPTYIGSELVTNGTFDTDTTGWVASASAVLTAPSGRLRVTSDASYQYGYQALTTEVGKVYSLPITGYAGTGNWNAWVSATVGGAAIADTGTQTTDTTVTLTFVATSTTTYVMLRNRNVGVVAGAYAEFDNVSAREIEPLAVSIAHKGAMTYADTGASADIRHYDWYQNGSNYIRAQLSTITTRTGQTSFLQVEGGTLDSVSGGQTDYSPGINVPFSIASWHASNGMNGAIEGTALTEKSTPTSIADLSAADFEIAPLGVVYTDRLLIWGTKIGDTGIEETSA
ncbi:MAG: hypothetical protein VX874_15950 [Pseudomonadota bacterium]|nr:hypothetical protein [Pseudomonadota bacterium]